MNPNDVTVLWREDDWRCEFHAGEMGISRLVIYRGQRVATAESTPSGPPALYRADALRERVRRGDLTLSQT